VGVEVPNKESKGIVIIVVTHGNES